MDRSGGATPRMLRAVLSGRSPSLKHLTAVARPEELPRARCTDEDSGVFNAREKSFRCRPAVRSRFRVYRRSTFHFRFSDTAIPLKETQIARRVLSCARARARGSLRITAALGPSAASAATPRDTFARHTSPRRQRWPGASARSRSFRSRRRRDASRARDSPPPELDRRGVARAYRRVGAPIGPLYRLSHPG